MPCGPVGRAAGLEIFERGQNLLLVIAGRGRQRQAGGAGIDHDRDAIVLAQLLDEQAHRLLDQRQLVRRLHRTGDVDQENQVACRPLLVSDFPAFQSDPDEPMGRLPGAGRDLEVDRERRSVVGWG